MITDVDAEAAQAVPVRFALPFGLRVPLGMAVGLLLAACFPPLHLFLLLPFVIAGLLLTLDGMTVRQAAYIGFACGIVFFGCSLRWLSGMFGAAAVSLWAICALFPACFCALWVWMRIRLAHIPAWLLAAILWTATEFFRSELMWPSFTWMGLGYAVVDAPLLAAPAAWLGSYGLTFGIVVLGAFIAAPFGAIWGSVSGGQQISLKTRARRWWRAGILLTCWLLLGLVSLPVPSPSRPLHVRLVQADSEDDEDLFRLSHSPSGTRADVIVWPEYSFVSDPMRTPKLWPRLALLAQTERSYLLFGAKDVFDPTDDRAFRNTAYLLDPYGRLIGKHVKIHTVPLINDGVPGRRADVFATAYGRLGVATCFDMDFADVARRLAAGGAEAFLVPSDNPREWGRLQHVQHVQLFQMRAVECGRWLATTDVAGNTFVVAPTGRVAQRVHTQDPAVLEAQVDRLQRRTFFVRGGWLFGPACLAALCLLFAWSLLPVRFRS